MRIWLVLAAMIALSGMARSQTASAADTGFPVVVSVIPEAGSTQRELYSIEVHFDRPVAGVDAADLTVNGVGATNVVQAEPGQFLFTFPQPADGTVSVGWRAGHSIADASDASRLFPGEGWTYTLDTESPAPGIFISEFMADNKQTYKDEDGDYSDWIEIFNSTTDSASLKGWFLTDDPQTPAKWRFPDITLPARSYLLVFASAKNKTNSTERLHTNFKLSDQGDYLTLVSAATNVVSAFAPAYPAQRSDVSYGRVEGDPLATGYFVKPTPGGENASSGPGFAPEVSFSRAGGTFLNQFQLTLDTASASAVVRYTLDGTMPTNTSTAYTAPILVVNSVQVRTRAYQPGLIPGPVRSETFVLLNSNLHKFTSDLPVMVLHNLGKAAVNSSRPIWAHLSVYESVNGLTSLTNAPTLTARTGVQIRGSSTEGLAKSSYKMELRDEFDMDRDLSLLGIPADSDWVLYAPNQFESVLIHNPFVHQLSRDMGFYSPRTRFVELYFAKSTGPLSSNQYAGIYVLEEKIKIGPNRVAIDKLQPEDVKSPEVTGGYLLKIDRLDPGDSGVSTGGARAAYVDPKEREIKIAQRLPQQQYLQNYFNAFSKALSATTWKDPNLGYAAYAEVDNWIDFHVLEVLSGNVDAMVLSTYFYKPRDGKIRYGPHWDFDRALGSTDGRDANPRVWSTGPFFNATWWSRMLGDQNFWQKWVDRWQDLRQSHFSLTNIHSLVDRLANEVRQAQPREYQKWRVALRGGSYQSEVNLMKNWLSNRIDFIDKQMTQPPRLSLPDGRVSAGTFIAITGPANATIFYTVDGSDPRTLTGTNSSIARTYTGPVRIDTNSRIVARARDLTKRQSGGPPSSTPWSRPVAATYVVNPLPLTVTEIMFHPASSTADGTNAASDFEFIELKNRGKSSLSLAGYRLSGDVEFTFTSTNPVTSLLPEGRVLVVRNRAAFLRRYPGATRIAGEYSGRLGNSGNRLTLTGPLREPVFDFTYRDDWSRLADGLGFSLVVTNESAPVELLGQSQNWRASALRGGSPGAPEPLRPACPKVYVNEIVADHESGKEDSIEVFNDEDKPADISGWCATDDYRIPGKYRFPSGAVVPAKGVLVARGDQFHAGGTNAFGLSAQGESVYLFSANANGELTGWYHGFEFGPQEPGASLGRWITSDGRECFAPYRQPSLGTVNPAPISGLVSISEIMCAPSVTNDSTSFGDRFVELVDLSGGVTPLPLFDPAHPTNTWRLRGGVDFDFPAGFRFPESRRIVLVGFDPERDTNALSGFRTRYKLDRTAMILGPWRGSLDTDGAVMRLFKPLTQADGSPLYTLVEEVHYRTGAPWPEDAASVGRSLVRRSPTAFGDDPASWRSGSPTPGDQDSDGDGMPDRWEIAHDLDPQSADGMDGPNGDPDGDGYTNRQEYLAGTAPRNAASLPKLTVAKDAQSRTVLTVQSGPSRAYTILYRDTVDTDSWRVLGTLVSPAEGGPLILRDTPTNATRFYRLLVQ